jgi:hypothetical protein
MLNENKGNNLNDITNEQRLYEVLRISKELDIAYKQQLNIQYTEDFLNSKEYLVMMNDLQKEKTNALNNYYNDLRRYHTEKYITEEQFIPEHILEKNSWMKNHKVNLSGVIIDKFTVTQNHTGSYVIQDEDGRLGNSNELNQYDYIEYQKKLIDFDTYTQTIKKENDRKEKELQDLILSKMKIKNALGIENDSDDAGLVGMNQIIASKQAEIALNWVYYQNEVNKINDYSTTVQIKDYLDNYLSSETDKTLIERTTDIERLKEMARSNFELQRVLDIDRQTQNEFLKQQSLNNLLLFQKNMKDNEEAKRAIDEQIKERIEILEQSEIDKIDADNKEQLKENISLNNEPLENDEFTNKYDNKLEMVNQSIQKDIEEQERIKNDEIEKQKIIEEQERIKQDDLKLDNDLKEQQKQTDIDDLKRNETIEKEPVSDTKKEKEIESEMNKEIPVQETEKEREKEPVIQDDLKQDNVNKETPVQETNDTIENKPVIEDKQKEQDYVREMKRKEQDQEESEIKQETELKKPVSEPQFENNSDENRRFQEQKEKELKTINESDKEKELPKEPMIDKEKEQDKQIDIDNLKRDETIDNKPVIDKKEPEPELKQDDKEKELPIINDKEKPVIDKKEPEPELKQDDKEKDLNNDRNNDRNNNKINPMDNSYPKTVLDNKDKPQEKTLDKPVQDKERDNDKPKELLSQDKKEPVIDKEKPVIQDKPIEKENNLKRDETIDNKPVQDKERDNDKPKELLSQDKKEPVIDKEKPVIQDKPVSDKDKQREDDDRKRDDLMKRDMDDKKRDDLKKKDDMTIIERIMKDDEEKKRNHNKMKMDLLNDVFSKPKTQENLGNKPLKELMKLNANNDDRGVRKVIEKAMEDKILKMDEKELKNLNMPEAVKAKQIIEKKLGNDAKKAHELGKGGLIPEMNKDTLEKLKIIAKNIKEREEKMDLKPMNKRFGSMLDKPMTLPISGRKVAMEGFKRSDHLPSEEDKSKTQQADKRGLDRSTR